MVYGWKTDESGKVHYLINAAFGKQWRENGSSSVATDSQQIVKFYQLTL